MLCSLWNVGTLRKGWGVSGALVGLGWNDWLGEWIYDIYYSRRSKFGLNKKRKLRARQTSRKSDINYIPSQKRETKDAKNEPGSRKICVFCFESQRDNF
jgi:hypothetical protein